MKKLLLAFGFLAIGAIILIPAYQQAKLDSVDQITGASEQVLGSEPTFGNDVTQGLLNPWVASSSILRLTPRNANYGVLISTSSPLRLSALDCSGLTNGGVLTTDASGNVECGDDDGGGGGGLTGGTVGFLARFTSATAVSKGIFMDNNSVGGINATSSTVSFNVQGTTTLNPFNVSSSTGTSILFVGANSRVGVGTTTPAEKFHVTGTGGTRLIVQDTTSYAAMRLDSTNDTAAFDFSRASSNKWGFGLNGSGNDFNIWDATLSDFKVVTLKSGVKRVGINTTTPLQTLTVVGANADDPFNVSSSTGTSLLRVLANGNVGIGTSTPETKLSVDGTVTVTGTTTFATNGLNPDAGSGALINVETDWDKKVVFWGDVDEGYTRLEFRPERRTGNDASDVQFTVHKLLHNSTTTHQHFSLYTSNAAGTPTKRWNIDYGADIADFDLDNMAVIINDTASASATPLTIEDGTVGFSSINASSSNYSIFSEAVQTGVFKGLLGVGESPNAVTAGLGVYDDGATGKQGLWFATGDNTSLSERLRISSAGNVGIGTTTPGRKLTVDSGVVAGATNAGFNLFADVAGNTGTNGVDITLNNSTQNVNGYLRGQRSAASAFVGIELGSNSRDGFRILTGSGLFTEQLRVTTAGRVGIGSSTPIATLTVMGTSTAPTISPLVVASSTGTTLFQIASNGSTTISSLGSGIVRVSSGALFTGTIDISSDTNLSVSATGLSLSGDAIALTAGYNIPLTASTTEWSKLTTYDKSFQIASTTLDTFNLSFSSATTTFQLWNPSQAVTLKKLYCKTDTGTVLLNFGGNLLSCTSSGASSTPSTNYAVEANVDASIGTSASSPNRVRVTATFVNQ